MISTRTQRILGRHVDICWPNRELIPEIPRARDNCDELLRKLTLVHRRMWQLEDDISLHHDDDRHVAQTRRELGRCFKNIRRRLVECVKILAARSDSRDTDVDELLSTCVGETLVLGALPVSRVLVSDGLGAGIERICILGVCIGRLHQSLRGDTQRPDTRDRIGSKLQQCIDVMLPRYLRALEQVWMRMVAQRNLAVGVAVKFYPGFRGSDVE